MQTLNAVLDASPVGATPTVTVQAKKPAQIVEEKQKRNSNGRSLPARIDSAWWSCKMQEKINNTGSMGWKIVNQGYSKWLWKSEKLLWRRSRQILRVVWSGRVVPNHGGPVQGCVRRLCWVKAHDWTQIWDRTQRWDEMELKLNLYDSLLPREC